MPTFTALGALGVLKESGKSTSRSSSSGTTGEETAVEALRAGAHDYVPKGNLVRLIPAIERELRETTIRADRRRAVAALHASEARYRRMWSARTRVCG